MDVFLNESYDLKKQKTGVAAVVGNEVDIVGVIPERDIEKNIKMV